MIKSHDQSQLNPYGVYEARAWEAVALSRVTFLYPGLKTIQLKEAGGKVSISRQVVLITQCRSFRAVPCWVNVSWCDGELNLIWWTSLFLVRRTSLFFSRLLTATWELNRYAHQRTTWLNKSLLEGTWKTYISHVWWKLGVIFEFVEWVLSLTTMAYLFKASEGALEGFE